MIQMGGLSHTSQTQNLAGGGHPQQQSHMSSMYSSLIAHQQEPGSRAQQMPNNAGSGVSASTAGAGQTGASGSGQLRMDAEHHPQSDGSLNYAPPTAGPPHFASFFDSAQRGVFSPEVTNQVCSTP
jgi:hypothetical protein